MSKSEKVDTHGPWFKCDGNHDGACMWCDGGLTYCLTCNAFEGATPDDCPGESMTMEQSDAVYAGQLNFRDGEWREECCQVMRHIYDLDNWMRESGYVRDGVNNAGNPKWRKIDG